MTVSIEDIEDLMNESESSSSELDEVGESSDDDAEAPQQHRRTHTLNLAKIALSDLPKLPTEHHTKQRQRNGGINVVLFMVFLFVGTTHGLALEVFDGFERESTPWWVFFILIYTHAGLAILGLLAMIWVDPGVVERTKESCYPIPDAMGPALQDYLEQKGHMVKTIVLPREKYFQAEDESGDTYCVRCMVWRRKKEGKHYHCNVCQRCVKQYDHHCSIFGRCIAGRMFGKGNYTYFILMICLFVTGFFTAFTAIVWSLSNVYGPEWVVPIACIVILYMMVSSKLLMMGPQVFCRACRRR